ncbi:MAG: peptide-binding protein [Desulfovibrionaceae bacterium]|nr:peptide-binding protein [Desulfovibrionaceae bacterium]
MRKAAGGLLAVLACALLVAGCEGRDLSGRRAPDQGRERPGASVPVSGGRIIQAMLGEPSNLIPPLATDGASHEIADHIYVAPLKYDKDIELRPWAAESYEILNHGRLLRFRLRQDIRWFDGRPLTAKDVEFTYRLMIDPKTPTAYAEDYKAVKEFRVLDPYCFEVVYDKPFARALTTWAHAILPKHALEAEDLLDTKYSRRPLGAGAYRLKEWVPGRRLVLTANPDYFEGRAYIDEVVYRIIPDQSTQFMELAAGNLDSMGLTPTQYLRQTDSPWWQENFRKYEYLSFSYSYLGYNLSCDLFKDVRVRRAIAMAIDKRELVKGVLSGLGVPGVGPYKPGTWAYNERLAPYEYDPAKAKALLAEAGWTDTDHDGVLDRDGRPFSFTILTNQGNSQRIAAGTILIHRLGAVGIKVRVRTVEWAAFIKEFVDKGRFEAVILGWSISQDPDIYDVWHSSKAVPGGLNFIGYKSPELDELLEKGRRTLDKARRKEIYDRVQEVLHRDQPYCFLYVPMSLPILHARIKGVEPAPAGIGYNFNQWWIPKDLQRRVEDR